MKFVQAKRDNSSDQSKVLYQPMLPRIPIILCLQTLQIPIRLKILKTPNQPTCLALNVSSLLFDH